MNTKHTRVVVTLFLALAALATVGFRAAPREPSAVSVLADEVTCELAPVPYTALERLAFIDEPCYAAMIDEVEHEAGKGVAASASTRALIDGILARSRAAGPWSVEALESSGTEQVRLAPRSASFRDWGLSETDVHAEHGAEIELDRGWGRAAGVQSLIDSICAIDSVMNVREFQMA